jgi:hypothetical protein
MKRTIANLGLLLLVATACQKDKESESSEEMPVASDWGTGSPSQSTPPTESAHPAPSAPTEGGAIGATRGTVLETMNSGGYTYARIDAKGTEMWVAGPETTLTTGSTVSFTSGSPMPQFRSSTLNRTFDMIYFVPALVTEQAGSQGGTAHTRNTAESSEPVDKVAVAKGGLTIAAIHRQKDQLSDKQVAVRGRVVKFNADILGRNWLHIRDGSAKDGDDLTVTTSAVVAVGDVVVVRGKVARDRDFGAGYKYDVLIEDASIAKE